MRRLDGCSTQVHPLRMGLQEIGHDAERPDVTSNWGEVSVLLGKGNATFGAPARCQTTGLVSFALGDMNGDGRLDIVTAGSAGMGLLLGEGDGSFAPTLTYGALSGTPALGDLDGDGRVDIAGAGYGVVVLQNSCQ